MILEYQQDPEKLINLVHKYEKEKADRKRLARQSMRRKMKNEKEKIPLLTSVDRTTEIDEEIDINENEATDQFPTMVQYSHLFIIKLATKINIFLNYF